MKRKICFFLALLTLFLSSSCGSKKPSETEPETTFKPASTTTEREDDPDIFDFSDKEGERNVFVTGEDILVLFNEAKEYCERYGTIRGKIISNSYEGDKWTGENRARPLEYIEETINPNRETIALFNQGKYEELSSEQFVKCVDDIMTVLMMNITSFCDPGIIFSDFSSLSERDESNESSDVRFAVMLKAELIPDNKTRILSGYEKALIKLPFGEIGSYHGANRLSSLSIYREGQRKPVCPTNQMTLAIRSITNKEREKNAIKVEQLDLRKEDKLNQVYVTEDDIIALLEKSKNDYLKYGIIYGEILSNSYKKWSYQNGYTERLEQVYYETVIMPNLDLKGYIASGDFEKLTKIQLEQYVHDVLFIFMMNTSVCFSPDIILSESLDKIRTFDNGHRLYRIMLESRTAPSEPSKIIDAKNAQVKADFLCTELDIVDGMIGKSLDGPLKVLFSKDMLN